LKNRTQELQLSTQNKSGKFRFFTADHTRTLQNSTANQPVLASRCVVLAWYLK